MHFLAGAKRLELPLALRRLGIRTRLTGVWWALPIHRKPAVGLAVCAIFKDEAEYLPEWVTFHRLMGVEEFYLYDNGSTDDWRRALGPELASGTVGVTPWPADPLVAQLSAYSHCLSRSRRRARWIAFLDIDEFLFSPLWRPLPQVLAEFDVHPAILAAWRVYGTGGVAEKSPGLVTETFLRRASDDHFLSGYGKAIADPRRTVANVASPHRFSHYERRRPWRLRASAVDEQRRAVTSDGWRASATTLRINHYYSRSEAEALEKWRRGSVTRATSPPLSELVDPKLNEVRDETLLRVVDDLRERLGDRHAVEPTSALPPEPLVSVCIPAFNSGDLVVRAVRSALNQDYPRVEVVVVDDASTDGTAERLRSEFGSRIRLFAEASHRGQARARNLVTTRSRGELVKFLDHDDQLDSDCVSRMVPVFLTHPSVGLAFARRRIELAQDAVDDDVEWREHFAEVHCGFTRLAAINRGTDLFEDVLGAGLFRNWVGEPSSVMVRRSSLIATGGFNLRTRQLIDLDLWLRLLARYDAAFIDRELSTYRHSGDGLTARHNATGASWLDRLWILENLLSVPTISNTYPELAGMRASERHMASRAAVRGMLGLAERSGPPRPWIEYLGYRIRSRISPVALSGAVMPIAGAADARDD